MARILMVDDEPDCRETTGAMLKDKGYEFIEASDAGEFLSVINDQARTIDLIILDLDMPGMNGGEVLEKFGFYLKRKKIPVILYTSVYDDDSKGYLLNQLGLYGEYAPVSAISKREPENLMAEIERQLCFRKESDTLTEAERVEKQRLDNKLRQRSLDIQQLPSDPEWCRLLELNCKENADTLNAEKYRKMREDYYKRKN